MDSAQYRPFESSDNSDVIVEADVNSRRGMRSNKVVYCLYGLLLLLLLSLLMVTGIKFSALNQNIVDVKSHLELLRTSLSKVSLTQTEEITEVLLEPVEPVRGRCEEGWSFFQSSCYLLSNDTKTWREAEQHCTGLRAHLLVVNGVSELDYISKIVEVKKNYWMGLVERQHEGQWTWVDGTDYRTTQTFWDEGQPDDWDYRLSGEDCGQLHSSVKRKRKRWNDADCSLPYRYICEAQI